MANLSVRQAGVSDLDRCAEVLGSAFADYPWTRWCVDGDDHVGRITALQRVSLEVVGFPLGMVWASSSANRMVSVAVWSDGRTAIDPETWVMLADRSRPLHGDRLGHAMAAEQGGHPRPNTHHLFLETMGTDPQRQREGHGSAVLRPGLDLADERGSVCALETSTIENVAFYQTVGFDVVDHRTVVGGGPNVWTMWRTPTSPNRRL